MAAKGSVHYFGPSGVRALPVGVAAKQSVHDLVIIFLSFSATYFSPRCVYAMVLKICTGPYVPQYIRVFIREKKGLS